jgi:pSer/pThr/pTyr-binding forkhead associated (FHA) protein
VITGEFEPLHPGSDQAEAIAHPGPPASEQPVIIELLGGQGQVRYRTRLTMLPAVIGRGYDADVLIDDPHVCARHAELAREADGSLVLRDLGSVNGIGRTRAERAPQVRLSSGDRVRLGPVEIRVVDASHPVPAAMPLAQTLGLTTGLLRPARALAVCGGALAVFALLNYQSSAASEAAVPAVQEAVYVLAAVAIWASGWALATRLVSRGFRFLPHWAWALAMGVVAMVLAAVGEWIDFVGPSVEAGTLVAAVGSFALLPVLIAGHLEIATTLSRRRRWRAALSVGGILVALTLIASLGDDRMENTWSLDFSGTLKPLPERMVPAVSLDGFMKATESLKAEVDEMADQPAPDDSEIAVPLVGGEDAPDSASVVR